MLMLDVSNNFHLTSAFFFFGAAGIVLVALSLEKIASVFILGWEVAPAFLFSLFLGEKKEG